MSAIDSALVIDTLQGKDPQLLASQITLADAKDLPSIFQIVFETVFRTPGKGERYRLLSNWHYTLSLVQEKITLQQIRAVQHPDIARREVIRKMWESSLNFIKMESAVTLRQMEEFKKYS